MITANIQPVQADIEIKRFDVYKSVNDIEENSPASGLEVVNAACVAPKMPPFECQLPDEYSSGTVSIRPRSATLFWRRKQLTSLHTKLISHLYCLTQEALGYFISLRVFKERVIRLPLCER